MPKSVGPEDSDLNEYTLDGYEEQGDARAAWGAIGFCIKRDLKFPPWVLDYLSKTSVRIEEHLVNRDEQHYWRLWQALGLDKRNRDLDAGYDPKRNPEQVYELIADWIDAGECKNISKGALRYWSEVLGELGSPETVRGLFHEGRKRSAHRP